MQEQKWKLLHIGVVVKDLSKAVTLLEKMGGIPLTQVKGPPPGISIEFKLQHVQLGDVDFELFEQKSGNSPLTEFIDRHGEGVHHIAFGTTNIETELDVLRRYGIGITEEGIQADGRSHNILHTQDLGGILVQLVQKKNPTE